MPRCLMCSEDVEGTEALCAACERRLGSEPLSMDVDPPDPLSMDVDPPDPEADTPVVPVVVTSPVTQPPAVQSPLLPAKWKGWHVAAAFAAAGGAAAFTFALLGSGGAGSQGQARVAQASFAGGASASALRSPVERSVHTWTDANSARWVSNHPRSVAYELAAENTASAGLARVRPILVVRCLANTTEAFVFTQWPAAIDAQDDKRTAHISFDGEDELTERWLSSESRDALFAPDGVAFARRLARGQTLRFGFTPHNGPRETIEFNVGGFAGHVQSLSRLCRWK